MPREDEGKDWGEAFTSQEVPEIVSKPRKTRGEAWTASDSSQEEPPENTLISD